MEKMGMSDGHAGLSIPSLKAMRTAALREPDYEGHTACLVTGGNIDMHVLTGILDGAL
jgi:hypothetical protein